MKLLCSIKNTFIFFFLLFIGSTLRLAWTQSAPCPSFTLQGNFKTKKSKLYKILKKISKKNQNHCPQADDFQELKSLLERSQLYYKIELHKKQNTYQLELQEKWTLIPIVKGGNAAGVSQFVLGAYDPDVFGTLNELGFQYENFDQKHSYVFWFRSPTLPLPHWKLGASFWSITRNQSLYEEDRSERGAFSFERLKLQSFLERRLPKQWSLLFKLRYEEDQLGDDFEDELKIKNLQSGIVSEGSTQVLSAGMEIKREHITEKNEKLSGSLLRIEALMDLIEEKTLKPHLALEAQYYKPVSFFTPSYWALRSLSEYKNRTFLSQKLYLGSFDRLRGYLHNQWEADFFSLLNLEFRSEIYRRPSFLLQKVLFSDTAYLRIRDQEEIPASVGGGLRLIFPKVYRLRLRLDAAYAYTKSPGTSFSVGLQQFF